ncbi:unnamed protein product [Miscanthus lutarioriparius]|uniref:chitinase n=1 Tax=Miscanthus lutarioriparius TaxID=422564 RepID=A0A811R1L2_9POAL|nr:unnamed protein product [Miscanthus lutarioriparius]
MARGSSRAWGWGAAAPACPSSVVTEAFFNGIQSQAGGNGCEGKNFYTRSAFVSAADSFPAFAHGGTEAEGRREIAAFFAHVTYETGYFCYINQINGNSQVSCALSSQWPCALGKKYYGRGPLQISWNFNYGFAHGGSKVEGKCEITAFFAHVTHETGHFCYINGASRNYCDASNRQWPSVLGKKCYGHGSLQISWNYNYGPAGKVIGFDGLGNPDKVAQDHLSCDHKVGEEADMEGAHGVGEEADLGGGG